MEQPDVSLLTGIYESIVDPSSWGKVQQTLATLFDIPVKDTSDYATFRDVMKASTLVADCGVPGLIAHVMLAHRIKAYFEIMEERCGLWAAVFEAIPTKTILVDSACRVKVCSGGASRLLNCKDGLYVSNEKLVATKHACTSDLQYCISAAPPISLNKVLVTSVPRDAGALLLSFVSLQVSSDGRNPVLIQIVDPTHSSQLQGDTLCRLYGLTRAESLLACELASGLTVEQSASKLFVSTNTARTHLKRIFQKTNTTRQPELIALLLKISSLC